MKKTALSLFNTTDVRAMDAYAIDTLGIDSYLLMTRAAQFSLNCLIQQKPHLKSLLVLCGAGNNGGDGYVLARLAKDAGLRAVVCSIVPPDVLSGDAARAHRDFVDNGGILESFDDQLLDICEVVVDALLGTGLTRDVIGEMARVIVSVNQARMPVLSLDIPSGLSANQGLAQGCAIKATWTCTFVAPKIGLYTGRGKYFCGQIFYHDLELPDQVFDQFKPAGHLISKSQVDRVLMPRAADNHKGQHGKVLIVAGGASMAGAAMLCGKAALRAGAGVVKVACHPDHALAIVMHSPELIAEGIKNPEQINALIEWCDVIAVGPGLGRDLWASQLVRACLDSTKPVIADADALYVDLSRAKGLLVVTPHPGEAAHLLAESTQQIQTDRLQACVQLAKKFNCIAVLKGAGTVVCSDAQNISICDAGNAGMATAGSGDVLTGVMVGIFAQQTSEIDLAGATEVAKAAVWVHAQCGDAAAARGMRGIIASDLIEQIQRHVN